MAWPAVQRCLQFCSCVACQLRSRLQNCGTEFRSFRQALGNPLLGCGGFRNDGLSSGQVEPGLVLGKLRTTWQANSCGRIGSRECRSVGAIGRGHAVLSQRNQSQPRDNVLPPCGAQKSLVGVTLDGTGKRIRSHGRCLERAGSVQERKARLSDFRGCGMEVWEFSSSSQPNGARLVGNPSSSSE